MISLNPFKLYAQISALFKIQKEVTNMKMSELSTSSGRLILLNSILTIAAAAMGLLPAVLVAKIAATLIGIYTLYRAIAPGLEAVAKMTATPKDDAALAELKAAVDLIVAKLGTPAKAAAEQDKDNTKPMDGADVPVAK